ncbi:PREDICTED: atherin-like [Branchiostoma belcheri]|uniref:Atherin-like n=1 Tax=Branchiostoma belcheri TaxID=7741 RepID=A0A6P5A8D0_BRABE|nr:PREDICTED: atherin-like [Branchiostoma belcheri]
MKSSVLLLAAFLLKVLVSSPGGQAQTTATDPIDHFQPDKQTNFPTSVARVTATGNITLNRCAEACLNSSACLAFRWPRAIGFYDTCHMYLEVGEPITDSTSDLYFKILPAPPGTQPTATQGSSTEGSSQPPTQPATQPPKEPATQPPAQLPPQLPPLPPPQPPPQPPTQPPTQPTTTPGHTTEAKYVPADDKVGPGVLAGVAIATVVVGFILGVGVSRLVQWCRSKPKGQSSRQAGLEGENSTAVRLVPVPLPRPDQMGTVRVHYDVPTAGAPRFLRQTSGQYQELRPAEYQGLVHGDENDEEEEYVEPIAREDSEAPYEAVDDSYLELQP